MLLSSGALWLGPRSPQKLTRGLLERSGSAHVPLDSCLAVTQGGEMPEEGLFPFPQWEVRMFFIEILGMSEAFGLAMG